MLSNIGNGLPSLAAATKLVTAARASIAQAKFPSPAIILNATREYESVFGFKSYIRLNGDDRPLLLIPGCLGQSPGESISESCFLRHHPNRTLMIADCSKIITTTQAQRSRDIHTFTKLIAGMTAEQTGKLPKQFQTPTIGQMTDMYARARMGYLQWFELAIKASDDDPNRMVPDFAGCRPAMDRSGDTFAERFYDAAHEIIARGGNMKSVDVGCFSMGGAMGCHLVNLHAGPDPAKTDAREIQFNSLFLSGMALVREACENRPLYRQDTPTLVVCGTGDGIMDVLGYNEARSAAVAREFNLSNCRHISLPIGHIFARGAFFTFLNGGYDVKPGSHLALC